MFILTRVICMMKYVLVSTPKDCYRVFFVYATLKYLHM